MPGGDRTGPSGKGPRTGRAAGLCSGSKQPGYAESGGRGRGMGFGSGMGKGIGRRGRRIRDFDSAMPADRANEERPSTGSNPDSEIQKLTQQAQALQTELSSIQKRLAELND